MSTRIAGGVASTASRTRHSASSFCCVADAQTPSSGFGSASLMRRACASAFQLSFSTTAAGTAGESVHTACSFGKSLRSCKTSSSCVDIFDVSATARLCRKSCHDQLAENEVVGGGENSPVCVERGGEGGGRRQGREGRAAGRSVVRAPKQF